ncbi:tight adherence pilus pseudopilin TadF [Vibrio algarum]|uniref:Tight adherence pilus pseudopilin TadF n=1 Tax=Vibrio algarum TaxID=3020714 RepID=A0ABT4YP15_9VIBR|nr:tight adherence pilus pseudopilin TadF [Vibrio sp. KJ40-1]MDB1123137.1 tight adherence pilus pseudopilin TadF [Vibrio sp. KJ40-1]
MSIVSMAFVMMLMFAGDLVAKISMKGKLDRLSFSAASVAKERTQLYSEDYKMSNQQLNDIYDVMAKSLKRTYTNYSQADFGMLYEEQTYSTSGVTNALVTWNSTGGITCSVSENLSQIESNLAVTTSWGRKSTLYRVTLCYETENWLIGFALGSGFTRVTSSSVILGR